jgi:transposase
MVAACRRPGVSIASVAMSNGVNANLLRRWVVEQERKPALAVTESLGVAAVADEATSATSASRCC